MSSVVQFKALALIVVLVLFAVIVVLPLAGKLSDEAEDVSNISSEDTRENVEQTVRPWWEDLARSAPLLFVVLAFFLIWIGAGDIL